MMGGGSVAGQCTDSECAGVLSGISFLGNLDAATAALLAAVCEQAPLLYADVAEVVSEIGIERLNRLNGLAMRDLVTLDDGLSVSVGMIALAHRHRPALLSEPSARPLLQWYYLTAVDRFGLAHLIRCPERAVLLSPRRPGAPPRIVEWLWECSPALRSQFPAGRSGQPDWSRLLGWLRGPLRRPLDFLRGELGTRPVGAEGKSLVADVPRARVKPGQVIFFGRNGDSEVVCIPKTWFGEEAEGRWARTPSGLLSIWPDHSPGARPVARIALRMPDQGGSRTLTATANGRLVERLVTPVGPLHLDVPLSGDGPSAIALSCWPPFRPREHGTEDPRALGVWVSHLHLIEEAKIEMASVG